MLNSFSGLCLFSVHFQVDNAIDEKYVIDEKNGSSMCVVFSLLPLQGLLTSSG